MLGLKTEEEEAVIGNKVILNVGGIRHETYVSTLRNIPDTRLHSLTNNNPTQLPEFDPYSGEFFFDRHPIVFAQVLNYYRTGKLHCPNDVCGPLFEEELAFWGLEDASIETCCWMNYKKHGEAQANLRSFDKFVEEGISEPDSGFREDVESSERTRDWRQLWRKYQSKMWMTFEEPSRSVKAKIIATISMFLIVASVIVSCLETTEYFSHPNTTPYQAIYIIEIVCIIFFTLELLLRFAVCPSKWDFVKQIMNWLDLAAIFPFYLQLFLANSDTNSIVTLRIVRLIRVFRIFKLSRHSYSLQILGHTLKSSLSELFLLGFFLSIGVVVFSSLVYYAERESTDNNKFTSIPASFWWAVVTMTTVGYGDFTPKSLPGRLVGTCCAVCGVLCVALPIPVIVSNFSLYYSHAKARQHVKKKRPLVIGAANALKVIESFVGPRAMELGTQSERSILASGKFEGRTCPGNSFESSDASPSLYRRRNSRLTDRQQMWTHNATDPRRNLSNLTKDVEEKYTESKNYVRETNEELQCEGARVNDAAREACLGDNEYEFTLPTIKLHRNSSSSQGSESSNDDVESIGCVQEEKDGEKTGETERSQNGPTRVRRKKKSKKVRRSLKVSDTPPKSTPGLASQFPSGRMGRRDSVFVVGFTGKKWKAMTAKRTGGCSQQKTKTSNGLQPTQQKPTAGFDVLEVPLTPASRQSSLLLDTVSLGTTTTELSTPTLSISPTSPCFYHYFPHCDQQAGSKFSRRSSCPILQTNANEPSPILERKGTGWDNEDRSPAEKEKPVVKNENFQLKHSHLNKDGSFSSTSSESYPKEFEKGWARNSSSLVRQKALSSTEARENDVNDDEEEFVKKHKEVLHEGGNPYIGLNGTGKGHGLQCNGEVNQETGFVSDNIQPGMSACVKSGNTQKQTLSERRNVSSLTFDFPEPSKKTPDHSKSNSNPDAVNEKGFDNSTVSSPAKQLDSDHDQFKRSKMIWDYVENHDTPPQGNNDTFKELNIDEDVFPENQKDTTIERIYHSKDSAENIFSGFHVSDTICSRNFPANGAFAVPQYNHISEHGSRSISERRWDYRGHKSPKIMIEQKDSGISSVGSNSSVESPTGFTEKKGMHRGLLKTISEAEANEFTNTVASSFLENEYCEKRRDFIIDIKVETTV